MSEPSRKDEILNRHSIPASEVVQRVGAVAADPELWARCARERDEVFGVWSCAAHAFVYPDFQFCGVATSPYRQELFRILRSRVGFDPVTEDPGGWARAYWLYQPSDAISEKALATTELDCGDPVSAAQSLALFNDDARTPAEVFGIAPQAVVALARALWSGDVPPRNDPTL